MNTNNNMPKSKNILCLLYDKESKQPKELQCLIDVFDGEVVNSFAAIGDLSDEKRIYICGDVTKLKNAPQTQTLFIITRFHFNGMKFTAENFKYIVLEQVPLLVENTAAYFKEVFAKSFWNFIVEHQEELNAIFELTEVERTVLYEKTKLKLAGYSEGVVFFLYKNTTLNSMEFIISTDGYNKYEDDVLFLYQYIPSILNWTFHHSRPKKNNILESEYKGIKFNADEIYCEYYADEIDFEKELDITIYYPNQTLENERLLCQGTGRLINLMLGEKGWDNDIDYFETEKTPKKNRLF